MKVFSVILFILSLGLQIAAASELDAHPGYLESVQGERFQVSREVVILPEEKKDTLTLKDKIFNEKMTKEITREYEERFGRTEAEQVFAVPSRYFEKELQNGTLVDAEAEAEAQRKFGNFMIKRLTEHHVDNYLKESPSARPVYELKERISNIDLEVTPKYKFKIKYSLSRNRIDLSMDNPKKITNRITYRMGGSSSAVNTTTGSNLTATSAEDIVYMIGYPISSTLTAETDYAAQTQVLRVSAIKRLKSNLSTSLTGTHDPSGPGVLVGLSWRD